MGIAGFLLIREREAPRFQDEQRVQSVGAPPTARSGPRRTDGCSKMQRSSSRGATPLPAMVGWALLAPGRLAEDGQGA